MKSSSRTKTRTKAVDLTDRKILFDTPHRRAADGQRTGQPRRTFAVAVLVAGQAAGRDRPIKHYSAIIDHAAIGLKDIVFIEVTLDRHDEKVLSRFGDALAKSRR